MRKLGRTAGLILFALISVFATEKINAQGYDSTYILSIKQKFAIPEDVVNNDNVGIWKRTITWRSGNTITYAIQSNYKSAFSINSTTGVITIVDATKIKGKVNQQDTVINLIIRSTDSKIGFEDDTCEIRVKESKYCKFIDYSYTGTEYGTRTNPFNDFKDITVTAGYGFFIKRGNIASRKTYNINGFQATALHPTIISAFGSGNNPILDGAGLAGGNEAFEFYNTPSPSQYCYIYNIDVKNYPSMAFRISSRNSNFGLYNCSFTNNITVDYPGDLADVYFFGLAADTLINRHHELINLESTASWGPILKTDASGIRAYNIKSATANTLAAKGYNFRFAISYNSTLSHFWFIGGERSLQVRYPNNTITDGIITNSKASAFFMVTDASYNGKPNKLRINNLCFKNNENGIYFYNTNINGTIIENCRFESNANDGIYARNGGADRVIQNCSFINNGSDGIELTNSGQASTNFKVLYNTFYGNKGKAINALASGCASNIMIYNNTIMGAVDLSGASSETVRNNFYESLTSAATSSNNIVLSSINQSSYFKSPSSRNYELINTAANAINKGFNVGLSYDCLKVAINGVPDIGAYEYKTTTSNMIAVNNAPVVSNQSFVVKEDEFKNNVVGKVVASDIDTGQQLNYSIVSGNESGFFTINAATGELTANSGIFSSKSQSVELSVNVSDNAIVPTSSIAKISISFIPKVVAVNTPKDTISLGITPKDSVAAVITPNDSVQEGKSPEGNITGNNSIKNPKIENALNIYPNPSKGNINLAIDFNAISNESSKRDLNNAQNQSKIEVFDMSGKVIFSKPVEYSESMVEENMDLSEMPNGLYFVKVEMANMIYSKKLIISK